MSLSTMRPEGLIRTFGRASIVTLSSSSRRLGLETRMLDPIVFRLRRVLDVKVPEFRWLRKMLEGFPSPIFLSRIAFPFDQILNIASKERCVHDLFHDEILRVNITHLVQDVLWVWNVLYTSTVRLNE